MTTPRKYDRYRIPARFSRGGFSHEKSYRIKLANGEELKHYGFGSYLFDESGKRLPDIDFEGERGGYCEVIFWELANPHTAVVMPPQAHGCEHSGLVEVSKNDLQPIPRSEWNDHDNYGQ